MRYGEVAHFSHPQHRLRLEHLDTPFRCDGCKEVGIGARYRCPVQGCASADHDLHRQCALPLSPPPPPLRHPFYPKCAFHFMARAPGAPGTRYCNACGRDVAGFVYHCRACGFDLHPCCATLPHALDASDRGGRVGVRLYLHPKAEAACHRCGHRGRSWTYRSHCKSYSLHVACVMDMVVESWHGVGRNKGASAGGRGVYDGALVEGSGGYRVPVIRGAAKSSHASRGGSYWGMRKGKVKRCCEIAGFAAQVVISAVLGDPTALIAGVVGSLIARKTRGRRHSRTRPRELPPAPSRSPSALGFGRRRRRRRPVPSPTPPPPRGRDPSLPASCWPGRAPPPPPPRRPAAAALGLSSNPAPLPSPRAAGPVRLLPPPGLTPPSPCVRPLVQSGGRRPTPADAPVRRRTRSPLHSSQWYVVRQGSRLPSTVSMDLAPFKMDIDELLDDYAKENCTSFIDFKRVWMAKKFSYIFEGRPKTNSGVFMQSLFLHCIGHMTSQSSLLQRLPGLYCLYCLYECQPYKPHFKIYLSLEESKKLKDFVIEAKQNGLGLVPALVKRMLDKGMFLFGFINLLSDIEAKEVDEMNASQNKRVEFACDKLFANTQIGSYTHTDLGVEFELDSIKKLSMDYAKAKESAFSEASQTVDVEDAKHILQNDKLLGDKVEEIVKEWDAQKEEFYQKTGVSPHDELAVVDNDESGEFYDDNETDAFDELEQLLLE